MTLVSGSIMISGNTPYDGNITIKRINTVASGGDIFTTLPETVSITGGAFSRELEPGQYQVTVDTLTLYWIVPEAATATLEDVNSAGITPVTVASSLRTLAEFILDDPLSRERITNRFIFLGDWDNLATYNLYETVNYNGSSYVWISTLPGNGTPGISVNWQLLASKGDTGSGTTGNNTAYGPIWDGLLDAPTMNAVYDGLTSALASKANLTNPAFLGNPTYTSPIDPFLWADDFIVNLDAYWEGLASIIPDKSSPIPKVATPASGSDDLTVVNSEWVTARLTERLSNYELVEIIRTAPGITHTDGTGDITRRLDVINQFNATTFERYLIGSIKCIRAKYRLQFRTNNTLVFTGDFYTAKLPMLSGVLSNSNTEVRATITPGPDSVLSVADLPKATVTTQITTPTIDYAYSLDAFVLILHYLTLPGTSFLWLDITFDAVDVTW